MVNQPAAVLRMSFSSEPLKSEESTGGKHRHLKTVGISSSPRLVRLLGCDVAARACRSVDIETKSPMARPLAHASAPIAHSAHG